MTRFLALTFAVLALLGSSPAYAQKICDLNAGAPALATDWIEVSKNCAGSRKLSLAQVKTYMTDSLLSTNITDFGTAVDARINLKRGASSGVASLDVGTKVPVAQIPNDALTSVSTVASQAEMLALVAQTGDVAIRSDENKTYILAASPATTLVNWKEIAAAGGGGGGLDIDPPAVDSLLFYDVSDDEYQWLTPGPTISVANDEFNTAQSLNPLLVSSYTVTTDDAGGVLLMKNAGATSVSIPSASTTGFTEGFGLTINSAAGTGGTTVTSTGSTIGGLANLTIPQGTGCYLQSDGSNWEIDYSACSAISTIQVPGATGQAIYNNGGVLGASSRLTFSGSAVTATAPVNIGTPAFTDTGTLFQATGSANSYVQAILQNTNSGSSASTDLVIGGDNMTSTTHFLDLGFNGSAGGGAPFTAANAAYLYTTDNELDLGAIGATGTINLATGTTPTTRFSVSTTGITASLPLTTTSTTTLGGNLNWSTGLGNAATVTGPLDQGLTITTPVPTTDINGTALTISTNTGGNPAFGTSNDGGNLVISTGAGRHNSSNSGGRGGDLNVTTGTAASFARGGNVTFTLGDGNHLGSSQNGGGGTFAVTGGKGNQSGSSTSFTGGSGGAVTLTGGLGGIQTGTTQAAGVGGSVALTGGTGGIANNTGGGTAGKGGNITFTSGTGGAATGSSGTRNGGAGGDILFNTGAGGTGATANGAQGKIGFFTSSPQAPVDINSGAIRVAGGTGPQVSSCGTSPAISGATSAFQVTVGTGTVTSCTVTFTTTYLTAPKTCSLTPANSTAAATGTTGAYVSSISTTGMVVTGLALAGASYYVQCM